MNSSGSFENAEQEIRGLVVELEKSMVQETLSQYDINTPIVVRDGQVYRQVLRQNKTYTSAAGPVNVERSLYRAEGQCICPLELQAGIIESHLRCNPCQIHRRKRGGYFVSKYFFGRLTITAFDDFRRRISKKLIGACF